MKIKAVSGIMLTLLLMGMLTLAFDIQTIKASGTIYIKADGSVDPDTAPISSVDNITYTLTDNIYDEIVIEKHNIVVDGAGYKVQGTGSGRGVDLSGRYNVTIKNMEIKAFNLGICLYYSLNNSIVGNNITQNNGYGIWLFCPNYNTISGNNVTNNYHGIYLFFSSYNTVSGNNITANNGSGIWLDYISNYNTISGNNITNNGWDGIWLDYSSNNSIVGNNITQNNDSGIWLSWSSDYNIISGNNMTNNGYAGILLVWSSHNTISGNSVTSNGGGIMLDYTSDYNTISGNNITANNWYGISFRDSSSNTISGNSVTSNGSGITLHGRGNTISGNNVTSNGSGIWVDGAKYNTVSGNNVTSNGSGMVLWESSGNTISGNNVTSNGSGMWLWGAYSNTISGNSITQNNGSGIELYESPYNTISGNNIIAKGRYGIWLKVSWYNTISGNNVTSNGSGMWLRFSGSNTISGNSITQNNGSGIELYESSYNTISGNNITANGRYGIWLEGSSNNMLRNNDASNNKYNFGVYGSELSHYIQNIDDSNTVDGKPVYYWVNRRDMAVPPDAGYVALVNCTNITLKDLNLTNNGQGVVLASTTNSTITKNNITENDWEGIRLSWSSNYNTISGNNITNNYHGIELYESSYNTISGNNITQNNQYGILLDRSTYNAISGNNITNNEGGIALVGTLFHRSTYNAISGNNITNNEYGIRVDRYSDYNSISGNNITNNGCGVELAWFSDYNSISGNNITNNEYGIRVDRYSDYNTIYHNNFVDNTEQVYSDGSRNVWDDGYPSGGNYWSDYVDVDFYGGPYQNETGSDGIWDHPYIIDDYNKDRYPFLEPSGWPEYPVAVIEAPAEGCINKELSFIGAYSYDPDGGPITSYRWDFGDGNVTSTANPIIIHAYTSIGTYKVTLVVTDDEESVSEPTEHTISIYALRPIAVIKALDEGYVKEPLTFDGSYSYDPDGGLIVSYQWDFGDGTSSTQQNPTHTYTTPGTYEVTLVVTDDESQVSDPATHTIKIKGPVEATQELIETIKNWNLPEGTENSLTSKLEEAILLLNKGNENGAIHKLMDFINQVEALRDEKLTNEQADYLIAEAQRIINLINE